MKLATVVPLIQRHYRVDAFAMLFWLRAVTIILLAPSTVVMGLPTDPFFYGAIIIFGIFVTYTDFLFFDFARHHHPAISARLLKPTVMVTFVLWFFLDPALFHRYVDHPLRGGAILILLCAAVILAWRLKQCTVTRGAFVRLWPVLCVTSLYPLFSKYILADMAPGQGAMSLYVGMAVVVMGTMMIVQTVRPIAPRDILLSPHTARVGAMIAIPSILSGVALVIAFQYASHPAYVSVVMMIVPVLLTLIGAWRGDPDHGHKGVGFALIFIAALITLLQIR